MTVTREKLKMDNRDKLTQLAYERALLRLLYLAHDRFDSFFPGLSVCS